VVLADKLHNLVCIELDLREGRPVWSSFHAGRDQVIWYYRATIDECARGDPRLIRLGDACRDVLARVEALG
jgi:hypothetical protein